MAKAQVLEIEQSNLDLTIKCKCGTTCRGVDLDFNDWIDCKKCGRQYRVNDNRDKKDIELEEI